MASAPPPQRWWKRLPLRLTVRASMLLILALGAWLGWLVHAARVQQDAITGIEGFAGEVTQDWRWDWKSEEPSLKPASPPGPRWLRTLLGHRYFGHVVSVSIRNLEDADQVQPHIGRLGRLRELRLDCRRATAKGMAHLQRLTALRRLTIRVSQPGEGRIPVILEGMRDLRELVIEGVGTTDDDLTQLAGLSSLEELRISSGSITDAGLRHLEGLTNLERLAIRRGRVTVAGLGYLGGMRRLRLLDLSGTRIEDLEPLSHLTRLENLDLSDTPIGDSALGVPARLTSLSLLSLGGTRVTDDGLTSLAGMSQLNGLRLGRTAITDAGLGRPAGLKRLRFLVVEGTGVTQAGIAEFLRAQPRTQVVR